MTKELQMTQGSGARGGAAEVGMSSGMAHFTRGASAALVWGVRAAIRAYQLTISPAQVFLLGAGAGCRYTPSCSEYAAAALREHGVVQGTALAAKRFCRCHPWGGCGHDPVPPRNQRPEAGDPRLT